MIFSNVKSLSDSHFHILEMKKKEMNIDNFLTSWEEADGKYLIDIGVDENSFRERLSYSDNRKYLYHSAGIHPNSCDGDINSRMLTIEEQLQNPKVIAVGETGLDYYWKNVDKTTQESFFRQHIKLAIKYNLPIIIHNREACSDLLSILTEYKGLVKGIIHCFSSEPDYAIRFIELGFYISFSGNITYKKNLQIKESLKTIPMDKILVETDSPYLSPQVVRGTNNHPGNIGLTLDYICDHLDIPRNELSSNIKQNFSNIFNLSEDP